MRKTTYPESAHTAHATQPPASNALATNGHLHDAALSFLGSIDDDDTDPDVPRRGPGSVSSLRDRQAPPVLD